MAEYVQRAVPAAWRTISPPHSNPRSNRLLAALPDAVYTDLVARLEHVVLPQGYLCYDAQQRITAVLFPLTAVSSLVVQLESGDAVEAATVGNDGLIGLPVALGLESDPLRAIVQIPGAALRLPAGEFRERLARQPELRALVLRYAQTVMLQMSRSAACNRAHALKERMARWLLELHDRAGRESLPLTQDYLATMLGVRRASVTVAAGALQEAGLIRYRRGMMEILDRPALEQLSCDCYEAIRRHAGRLLR